MKIIYGTASWSGITPQITTQVDTSKNPVINTLYDPKGEPIFQLVEHSEVKFGFQPKK